MSSIKKITSVLTLFSIAVSMPFQSWSQQTTGFKVLNDYSISSPGGWTVRDPPQVIRGADRPAACQTANGVGTARPVTITTRNPARSARPSAAIARWLTRPSPPASVPSMSSASTRKRSRSTTAIGIPFSVRRLPRRRPPRSCWVAGAAG